MAGEPIQRNEILVAYKQKKCRGKDEKGRKRDGAEKIYPSGCWRNGNQRKCVGRKWSKNENPEISSTGAEEHREDSGQFCKDLPGTDERVLSESGWRFRVRLIMKMESAGCRD